MNFNLKIWRQKDGNSMGKISTYRIENISEECSFLEMLDVLNQQIIQEQQDQPVAFDHDCREGICGSCSLVINGVPHGPKKATTTCQLHMRTFKDEDTIYIEPFRASSFPIIKDLIVNRNAFDRIIQAGGYISINTGSAIDGNEILISKESSEDAMDNAACIGCGACVASCKNASAMLFVGAKVKHLGVLPQGKIEESTRVKNMVAQMDEEGFGNCTNQYECEAVCPKEIKRDSISFLNKKFIQASLS